MILVHREGGGPVVTGGELQEDGVVPTEGDIAVEADQAALALAVGDRGLGGTVAQVPETGVHGEAVGLAGQAGAEALVDVETGDGADVQPAVRKGVLVGSESVVVGLIAAIVVCIHITVSVQRGRSITLVVIDQGVVESDLRLTVLLVVVAVVEAVAIGQGQVLERLDVGLQLTEDLLLVRLVVTVLDGPVRTGDTVRSHVGFRRVECGREALQVHQGDVTRQLIEAVDEGSTLELADRVGLGSREVDLGGDLHPAGRSEGVAHRNRVAGVRVLVARDDTVIVRVGEGKIIGKFLVLGGTVQGNVVLLAPSELEEILDVVLDSGVLVVELVTVPDRAVRLHGTVKLRTPGTVLDEGLGTVPTLSVGVLEHREGSDLAGFDTTAVGEGEVLVRSAGALLGRDDDHTVRSTRTVQSGSGGALQDGHALDVLAGKAAHAADDDVIDDVERLVGGVDGAETADDDAHACTRVRVGGRNLHTSNLTGKCVGNVGGVLTDDLIVLDGRRGVADGLLRTGDTHGRDDDFVEKHRVFIHHDIHLRASDFLLLGNHAVVIERKRLTSFCTDAVNAVSPGDNTGCRTVNDDRHTGERLAAPVCYHTGHALSLRRSE